METIPVLTVADRVPTTFSLLYRSPTVERTTGQLWPGSMIATIEPDSASMTRFGTLVQLNLNQTRSCLQEAIQTPYTTLVRKICKIMACFPTPSRVVVYAFRESRHFELNRTANDPNQVYETPIDTYHVKCSTFRNPFVSDTLFNNPPVRVPILIHAGVEIFSSDTLFVSITKCLLIAQYWFI